MIKHIVIWTLHDQANGLSKQENALQIKQKLEDLNGTIDGLLKIEVGINAIESSSSGDLCLYSEFASEDDLQNYQVHPEHKKIKEFMQTLVKSRSVIDYVI